MHCVKHPKIRYEKVTVYSSIRTKSPNAGIYGKFFILYSGVFHAVMDRKKLLNWEIFAKNSLYMNHFIKFLMSFLVCSML